MTGHDDLERERTGRAAGALRRGSLWIGVAAAGLLGVLAGGIIGASSDVAAAARWRSGFGHAHWGGPRHGPLHAELARERAEWVTARLLHWIDASDAQQERAEGIVGASVDDLLQLAETHHEHREALVALLLQPTIDRDAIEEVRRAELALADEASHRIATALADVAEVLTPEQRLELRELARRFHD